jgi:hypothetical protein
VDSATPVCSIISTREQSNTLKNLIFTEILFR